jgi:hypothetical protein
MAIPITPQDTQKNCAPVSSNCVIWQGPDIPLINLCKGDSISDVTAKLASELTTLIDQLNITGFDVSCFPPICPKPENIHDLIQFILDTLCNCCINNQSGSGTTTPFTCTDALNCEIPIAVCFQYVDNFGNNVNTMTLSNYAQAIANKVCNITTEILTINNILTDHETRLDTLEACVLPCDGAIPEPTVPSSVCILPAQTNIPIVDFVEELELQFCNLKDATGTPSQITTSIGLACNIDAKPSLSDPIANPSMSTLAGWTSSASIDTLAESFGNLWLTVCDLREAFINLQTTVQACCGVSCADNIVSLSGLMTGRFDASLVFSGTINNAFQFCAGTFGTIKVSDPWGNVTTMTTTEDIINDINNNVSYTLDFSTLPGSAAESLVVYNVKVEACLTTANNSLTCNILETVLIPNTYFLETASYTVTSPTTGQFLISFTNPRANTTYVIYLKDASTNAIVSTYNTGLQTTVGTVSKLFTGLSTGDSYYCSVTATQNLYTISCSDTNTVIIS